MPTHDAYLRRTPLERFLPDAAFGQRHYAAIRTEAEAKGISLDDPGAFAMLEAATAALDEVRHADDPPETLARHALVLFHAFHLDALGSPAFLIDSALVRALLDAESWDLSGSAGASAPSPLPAACYLQLPQHLIWVRSEGEAAAPASIDGFFRTLTDDGRMHLLPVVGLLEGRDGFTVLPLPGLPLSDAPTWATTTMRQDGPDFASDLPGAEHEGLYEVCTAGEVLKLVARLEEWLWQHSDALGAEAVASDETVRPMPSALRGRRLGVGASA
jgi:hypothetical protein